MAPAQTAPAALATELAAAAVKPEAAPLALPAELSPLEVRKAPVLAPAAEVAATEPVALAPVAAPAPTLRTFTVPYVAREGSANRVIIQVTFNDAVTVPMALDTGAPGTIISSSLAERLGLLKPNEGRLVTVAKGIGGQTAALVVVLNSLAVDKARTDFVLATVVTKLSEAFEGVVGMDFVAGYALELDTQRKLLVLKELPPGAASPGGHDERWWREAFGDIARQKTAWARLSERLTESLRLGSLPQGLNATEAQLLADLAVDQNREIEVLAGKLERHASKHAVPREWRSY
jgi:hypothetical protein